MTPTELKTLESTILASFLRSNVLSVGDAADHANLAVMHVRKALAETVERVAA